MKQRRRIPFILISSLILPLTVTGCAGQSKHGNATNASGGNIEELNITEPVTLKLYSHYAAINTPSDVEALFGAVKKKYPNIDIELVKGVKLEDMVASGDLPDLFAVPHGSMGDLISLGVVSDMNEFVSKYQVDMKRFVPQAIDALKSYGKKGELYGIPYTLNYGVLIYNKDIFDRFGASYPKDNMTWQQIIDLSKKLTRMDNGTQYIGFDPGSEKTIARGYSLGTMDAKGQPILDSEGYKKVFNLLEQMYSIPGMVQNKKYSYGVDYFIKDQKLAMFPTWLAAITSRLPALKEEGKGFNWDIAGHPIFDDKTSMGRETEFQSFVVPPNGKNMLAAYRVILTMISDEAQTEMNKGNNLTILNNPEMRKHYASNNDIYKGKNLEGVFKLNPAQAPIITEFDGENYKFLRAAAADMILNNKDVNTVLRTAQEKATNYVQDEKARRGK